MTDSEARKRAGLRMLLMMARNQIDLPMRYRNRISSIVDDIETPTEAMKKALEWFDEWMASNCGKDESGE